MNDNLLRKAVDARLSGLTFTPQMQADTLRRAHPAGSTRMGRKLSYSLAFALLALLLAATAGAAAYFGVLHFHGFWLCVAALPLLGGFNILVSFYLAFRLALRAQNVSNVERSHIYKALIKRVLTRPLSFLLPLRLNKAVPQGGR